MIGLSTHRAINAPEPQPSIYDDMRDVREALADDLKDDSGWVVSALEDLLTAPHDTFGNPDRFSTEKFVRVMRDRAEKVIDAREKSMRDDARNEP
jgi:hypothetical protein